MCVCVCMHIRVCMILCESVSKISKRHNIYDKISCRKNIQYQIRVITQLTCLQKCLCACACVGRWACVCVFMNEFAVGHRGPSDVVWWAWSGSIHDVYLSVRVSMCTIDGTFVMCWMCPKCRCHSYWANGNSRSSFKNFFRLYTKKMSCLT